mgnify:CR=1 FL=1
MNLENKKVVELKKICTEKKLKGYSKLNKEELVQLLSKKNSKKKQSGGIDQNVYNHDVYYSIMNEQAEFKKFLDTYKNNTLRRTYSPKPENINTNIEYYPKTFEDYIVLIKNNKSTKIFNFNSYSNVNLNGADLKGIIIYKAILDGADLRSADLSGADLRSANLTNAILTDAILKETILISANLTGVDLINLDLTGTNLNNCDW